MMGLALERFFSRLPRYLRRHYLIAGQAGTVAIGRRVWQFGILCFVFMLPMQALSSPTSSGPSIFKREIIEIVKRGDYEEVERLLSKLQKMFDADETNESDVNRALMPLQIRIQHSICGSMNGLGANPSHPSR